MRNSAVVVGVLAIALAGAACGTGAPPPHDPPDEEERVPTVHILTNARPHDPASVEVEQASVRYGDPLHVRVTGLPTAAPVRVTSSGGPGTSSAVFVADGAGVVDLARDAPRSGDWDAADAEAFIWAMHDPPAGPLDLSITVQAFIDDEEVARAEVQRRYINDGLTVTSVASGRTVGALALPDPARFGTGPYPAVLTFGGSEGGSGSGIFQAQYLASLGYAALGVAYFGATGVPATLHDVPLELLQEDLVFLASTPEVDADRIGVMGGSRGGELALLLGATYGPKDGVAAEGPTVKAVVAKVPSGYVWGAASGFGAAWTLHGAALPEVPTAAGARPTITEDEAGIHEADRAIFLDCIAAAAPAALAAATIPIGSTDAAVLLLAGDDDQLWPSCVLADVAWEQLDARGHHPADRNLCFADAGHGFGIPGWSTLEAREVWMPSQNAWFVLGGTPAGSAAAARAADTAMRAFLEEAL